MDSKQLNHPAGSMLLAALAVVLTLAAPSQALPPERLGAAEPAFERGAHLLRKGKVEEAIPALARAAELAPNVPDVLRLYVQALLVAGDTERAREQLDRLVALDPGSPELGIFLGLADLRLGNWQSARTQLAQAVEKLPRSGIAQLLLGVAEQELGEYEGAGQAYTRALALDPSLAGQIAYRRGLLALDEQRYREALLAFRGVGDRLRDSSLARSAAGYAELLDDLDLNPLGLYVTAGWGYDSNLNLAGEDESFPATDLDTGRGITEVGASYRFGSERRNFRVGQTLYGQWNMVQDEFDQQISRTWAQGYVELNNSVALDMSYAFQFGWLDWGRFRRTHAIEPGVAVRIGGGLSSRIFLRYEDRRYYESVDDAFRRDGDVEHLGADFYYALPQSWGGAPGWLRAGYRYRVEHTDGSQYDSKGHQSVLTLSAPLPGDFWARLEGRLEWWRYDNANDIQPAAGKRRDRIATISLGLERELLEHLNLGLVYVFTDDHSNVDFFDYQRHQVSLLATYVY